MSPKSIAFILVFSLLMFTLSAMNASTVSSSATTNVNNLIVISLDLSGETSGNQTSSSWWGANWPPYLYVDAFDNARTGGTRYGSSPYLDVQDQPTNYVETSTTNAEIGDFDFENMTPFGTIGLVKLQLFTYFDTDDKLTVYLWDGSSWNLVGTFTDPTPGNWRWYIDVDVTSILDTRAKVNGAKLYLEYNKIGALDSIRVDTARIYVESKRWGLIETWTGTVSAPAAWQLIETWADTVQTMMDWSRERIYIVANSYFTPENGVNGGGDGTAESPYIIENWIIDASGGHGIFIQNTTSNFIVRNILVENGGGGYYNGIFLDNVINGKIDNNISRSNNNGIGLVSSDNIIVTGNTYQDSNSMGIELNNSDYNTVIGNISGGNSDAGIGWSSSNYNVIDGNTLENNDYGIDASGVSYDNIINNIISNNDSDGINIYSGSFNILDNNIIEGNSTGIRLNSNSDNNTLVNNTVENNTSYGIVLSSSDNNIIYYNYLLNNTDNNAIDDSINFWDNGSVGNWWSDWQPPEHPDTYGDGIAQDPRPIAGDGNQDNYPRVPPSPPPWRFIETWTGTVEAPAAWQLIETWTGTVATPNTPTGADVTVVATDPETGEPTAVTVTFDNVTANGNTTSTIVEGAPPAGIKLFPENTYYDITTTVEYTENITIALYYGETALTPEQENILNLMKLVDNEWVDITDWVDTENKIIYGTTTSLSLFGVMLQAKARGLKETAVKVLKAAYTGERKVDHKLDKAIDHIEKSLIWIDDDYLDPKHGHKVFVEEKKAVRELMHVIKKYDKVKDKCLEAIKLLVEADKKLAETIFEEAQLEKSDKELKKAEKELDKGKYDKAIDHYKKAWKHAQKALNH